MVLEEYLSFEGVRKCAQCYEALCWEDEEVYCFACKGGNTECPLSYKTWTPPRSAKLSTGGEARSRLATGRRARKVAVVRTPGTPAIPNPETSSPAIPSPGTGTATGTASGTDSATFDQIRGNHAQRTSRLQTFPIAKAAATSTASATATATPTATDSSSHIIKNPEKRRKWQMIEQDLKMGMSERTCAEKYDVSRYWIQSQRKQLGTVARKGSQHVLRAEEERILKETALLRQQLGIPLSVMQLTLMAQSVIKDLVEAEPGRVTGMEARDHKPNRNWVHRFMKRNELSVRVKTTKVSPSVSVEEVKGWAESTEEFLQKHLEISQDPRRLINLDETAYSCNTDGLKVVARRGDHGCNIKTSDGKREFSSLVLTVTASGHLLRPSVILKGVRDVSATHLSAWNPPAHLHPQILLNKKGFTDQASMLKVLVSIKESCIDQNIPLPVILFLDCATSHLTKAVIVKARDLGLYMWYIHPNATSILQPLDISVFGPLKRSLKERVYSALCQRKVMNKWTVLPILVEVLEQMETAPNVIKSGFRASGIYPTNMSAIKYPTKQQEASAREDGGCDEREGGDKREGDVEQLATIVEAGGGSVDSEDGGRAGDQPPLSINLQLRLAARKRKFDQFRIAVLDEEEEVKFSQLYEDGHRKSDEPLFNAYVILRGTSDIGSISAARSAVSQFLPGPDDAEPKNRSKRSKLPEGRDRYDPNGEAWKAKEAEEAGKIEEKRAMEEEKRSRKVEEKKRREEAKQERQEIRRKSIEEKKQERGKLLEEKKKQQESKKQAKSKKQQATKGKARQAGRQSKKEGWMDVGEEGTSLDAMVRNCLLPTSRLTVLQVLKTEIPFR